MRWMPGKSLKKFIIPFLVVLVLVLVFVSQRPIVESLRQAYKQVLMEVKKQQAIQASSQAGAATSGLPGKARVSPVDGMQMVYIPAGEFLMGTNDPAYQASTPEHKVYLDAYWIDRTEVTNAFYALCVQAGKCVDPFGASGLNPYFGKPAYASDPVIYITWYDARGYCKWAGRRLPSEAEWEKAARGTDGRRYPWGDAAPGMEYLNFDDNIGQPVAADRYPMGASPYGVLNMVGNVREWVADWYSPVYYRDLPYHNPRGPQFQAGMLKALRGSSFNDNAPESSVFARFAHDPTSPGINRGFRCASDDVP